MENLGSEIPNTLYGPLPSRAHNSPSLPRTLCQSLVDTVHPRLQDDDPRRHIMSYLSPITARVAAPSLHYRDPTGNAPNTRNVSAAERVQSTAGTDG
ncbi:unnamed protein product [Peniophora sp. CBMAI 1063]|nr:unnamed protein product [Peniophora sp. CBMAI 1063]